MSSVLLYVVVMATMVAFTAGQEDTCEMRGMTWTDCGTACPLTCKDKYRPPSDCTEQCVAGCVCTKEAPYLDSLGGCVTGGGCNASSEGYCRGVKVWSDCACQRMCDDMTRNCSGDCEAGCQCPEYAPFLDHYGDCVAEYMCTAITTTKPSPCPNCLDGYCSEYGRCMYGCVDGFYGDYCDYTCNANCVDESCSTYDGSCLYGCNHGYQGPLCDEACPRGCYGKDGMCALSWDECYEHGSCFMCNCQGQDCIDHNIPAAAAATSSVTVAMVTVSVLLALMK